MATSRPSILHKFVSNPPTSSPYGRIPSKRATSKSDDSAGETIILHLCLALPPLISPNNHMFIRVIQVRTHLISFIPTNHCVIYYTPFTEL